MAGSFIIPVANGLLEKKHIKTMGASVWLYLWLVDKQTSADGAILYGKPIAAEKIAKELGVSERTLVRWIKTLIAGGYILDRPLPRGHVFMITKAKKKVRQKCLTSDKSVVGKTETPDEVRQECRSSHDINGVVGKTETPDSSVQPLALSTTSTPDIKPLLYNKPNKEIRGPSGEEFRGYWNSKRGLPKIRDWSPVRQLALKTLCRNENFCLHWKPAIDAILLSPWHMGENSGKWRADVDWFLRSSKNGTKWQACWEKYGDQIAKPAETMDPALAEILADRARVMEERAGQAPPKEVGDGNEVP